MNDSFVLTGRTIAAADTRMNNDTVKAIWHSFCLTASSLELNPGLDNTFRIGDTDLPVLNPGKEFSLRADERGAAVVGRDYGGLMRGLMALMMKLECDGSSVLLRPVCEESNYRLARRMVHICVFPENDLIFIRRLLRLIAMCQYTHVVIEFWGMLKYDCLPELAWPNAFSKDEVRALLREVRALGVEPIPMFNQLGHATQSRSCYGKHVVLDQNPRLQYLFTPDGWAWDIHSDKVFDLLKQTRIELCDLFGPGEFIHIGCDEAYYYSQCADKRAALPDFMRRLTAEVAAEGRRPMLWMDMFLEKNAFPECYTVCPPDEVEGLMAALHPSSVLVDWQYDATTVPVASLAHLKDSGFDAMGAPWFNHDNYSSHIATVADNGLYGVMLTTWHLLKNHMPSIPGCARELGAASFTWSIYSNLHTETATLLRRAGWDGGEYADFGWSKTQIET